MGNCMWRVFPNRSRDRAVMVVTSTGGIMEFHAPIVVDHITGEFPGYGIFRRRPSSSPLPHNEPLEGGRLYYLLPLDHRMREWSDHTYENAARQTPYRMSLEGNLLWRPRRVGAAEPKKASSQPLSGVWKVRLVISPEQLSRILAEESQTHLLVESGRMVAKCNYAGRSATNSDARSSSSGRMDADL